MSRNLLPLVLIFSGLVLVLIIVVLVFALRK